MLTYRQNEILIQNYRRLIDASHHQIVIELNKEAIQIQGQKLHLAMMDESDLLLRGEINEIRISKSEKL